MGKRNKAGLCLCIVLLLCLCFSVPTFAKAKLSKKTATVYVGNTITLKATGFSGTVKWSSSAPYVATVKKGKVKGLVPGTTVITAKAGSTKKTCKVTVKAVELSSEYLSIEPGKTGQLSLLGAKGSQVEWMSSNRSCISLVKVKGNQVEYEAVGKGTAIVSATYMGKIYSCRFRVASSAVVAPTATPLPTVVPVATKVKINPASMTLLVGQSGTITLEGASGKVTFQSSNTQVMRIVEEKGNSCTVRAIAKGYSCITAEYQGKKYRCRTWGKKSAPTATPTPVPTRVPQTPTPTPVPAVTTQPVVTQAPTSNATYEIEKVIFTTSAGAAGDLRYDVIAPVRNTGNKNLYMEGCSFELSNEAGQILHVNNQASSCPKVIAPGEVGYFYNSHGTEIRGLTPNAFYRITVKPSMREARAEPGKVAISDLSTQQNSQGGRDVLGYLTNNSGRTANCYAWALYMGSDGYPVGIADTILVNLAPGARSAFHIYGWTSTPAVIQGSYTRVIAKAQEASNS